MIHKCKNCKKKVEHIKRGFRYYNERIECNFCGLITQIIEGAPFE